MKLKLILTTAILGTALALPGIASAAPPPSPTFQDSVSLTEAPAVSATYTPLWNSLRQAAQTARIRPER